MIHTDKNGKHTPIVCLGDTHLLNIIKLQFKKFTNNSEEHKNLEFVLGSKLPVCDVVEFNKITKNLHFYIMEAFRRNSTRDNLIKFFSEYNPLYKSDSKIIISDENNKLLNCKNINSDFDECDDFDEHEEY